VIHLLDERLRLATVAAYQEEIERGALRSIDEGGTRVRMLPLRRSQDTS
jgi:ABC-type arginine/histidine transport system permease subunit